MSKPLAGLKVLDLSRFIAGPHCTTVLGDLGADVVKVERPTLGDDTRAFQPEMNGASLYYLMFNRNKRGMTLDFRNPEAQVLLRRLAAEADVLVENFRPGTMERMGCSWEELHTINPRLIMARISGYGQTTSMASQPCFDGIAQATSGLMDLTGSPDGSPMQAGTFVVDYSTALYSCIGILAALQERHKTGKGRMVDVSLMSSAVSLLMTAIPEYVSLGAIRTRAGNRDRYTAPSNTFRAQDGAWVHVMAGADQPFKRFAEMIGKPGLLQDPRFSTLAARMQNVEATEALVAEWISNVPADEAVQALNRADLPSAKVSTIKDVVENPYMREAGNIIDVDHPSLGLIAMSGPVIKMGSERQQVSPAPRLGEHTDEVLADWLDLHPDEVETLRTSRAV
ncbi:CoA transferase [Rhizobium sp. P32RR-XVIII]|uniref:CaiB/BaiF CoA transferase family protein n=1 Tax=Rhizobium sp. P32RR-XVIII TaxID=2726738 RepID=UPI00145718F9|nr:CoA transferase [Rhizobium sp. P32RR-XVIII]NLS07347.1 CoA transferase [Rhizobium sp. P32RR-XVIII]